MDEGDGDLGCRGRAENVAQELEDCKRKRCLDDVPARISDSMSKCWYRRLQSGEEMREVCGEDTPARDESELDDAESDGLWEGVEDGFRGRVREGGGHVPDYTQRLQQQQ